MKSEVAIKKTPSFSIVETIIINPKINGESVYLQFELRENQEITVIGGIDAITKFLN